MIIKLNMSFAFNFVAFLVKGQQPGYLLRRIPSFLYILLCQSSLDAISLALHTHQINF